MIYPLPEAQARLQQALEQAGRAGLLGSEDLPLDERCVGRVLVEPVWAKISSPHYHASAMDGYALSAAVTAGADLSHPVILPCHPSAGSQRATYLDTGDPLPEWADAVIPIENVEPIGQDQTPAADPRRPYAIRIRSAVVPWSYVRPIGEDIVATQLVLPAGGTPCARWIWALSLPVATQTFW